MKRSIVSIGVFHIGEEDRREEVLTGYQPAGYLGPIWMPMDSHRKQRRVLHQG